MLRRVQANILFLALLFLTLSCQKEMERMDNLFLEFATVEKQSSAIRFRLDNQQLLTPKSNPGYKGRVGQRVILNYTPLSGDTIKINQVVNIFTSILEEREQPMLNWNPIWLQSAWVSGGYLNMIIEVEYYQGGHKLELTRNKEKAPADIFLYFSREKDPPGFRQKMYLSFSLQPLTEDDDPVETLNLYLNTEDDGIRILQLENR